MSLFSKFQHLSAAPVIRSTAVRLTAAAQSTEEEIGRLACADAGQISEAQEKVRNTFGHLKSVHNQMRQSVAQAGERSEALSVDVRAAIHTLQFQDRLSQRIRHTTDAMGSMTADWKRGSICWAANKLRTWGNRAPPECWRARTPWRPNG